MGRRLSIGATALAGVHVVRSERLGDERGSFSRLFCSDELAEALAGRQIQQINHTVTRAVGTVRGLHYQHPPHAEMKLVRCLRGRVWDVAVDLRAGSPTFGQWHAEVLSPDDGNMLVIPEGCAHGFQALAPDSELLYLHTRLFAPQAEGGVHCQDARLALPWPLPIAMLSARDAALPMLAPDFPGIGA